MMWVGLSVLQDLFSSLRGSWVPSRHRSRRLQNHQQGKEARTKVNEEEPTTTTPESLDDIQLQTVEDEAPSEPEPSADEDMVIESTIEVIESVEETPHEPADATASGRLASLREEIGTDGVPEREGSFEDRMKKFFGNE